MKSPPLDLAALDKRTLGNAKLRAELLRLFREHALTTLRAIDAAVARRDAAAVTAGAHQLKGSAATISASALSDAARRLEEAATTDDWPAAAAELTGIDHELSRCVGQIDRILS